MSDGKTNLFLRPNRNEPWNDLPPLPIRKELHGSIEILRKHGNAKASLGKLHGVVQ